MERTTSIWISGVGGQGTILAAELVALAALEAGLDTKKSEVHGMAQRGGSVVSQVRLGQKVHSPLIAEGDADVLLAFERVEALRYAHVVKKGGVILYNDQEIQSATTLAGLEEYPRDIDARLRAFCPRSLSVPAERLADMAGSVKSTNVVLLGVLAGLLPIDLGIWPTVIKGRVPAKTIEINLRAFENGRRFAAENKVC